MMIETRKIISAGRRSRAVTLPKKWVVQHGIRPGDPVEIIVEEDGSLRIRPLKTAPSVPSMAEVFIEDPGANVNDIVFTLIGYYVNGYNVVSLPLTQQVLEALSRLEKMLVGVLYIDMGERVKVKFIVSEGKIGSSEIASRLASLLSSLAKHYMDSLDSSDPERLGSILAMEEEIDRLYYLGLRVLNTEVTRSIAEWHVEEYVRLSSMRVAFKVMEDIADAFDRSARTLVRLGMGIAGEEYTRILRSVSKIVLDSAQAFLELDRSRASRILRLRIDVKRDLVEFKKKASVETQMLISELEIMLALAADLAEITITDSIVDKRHRSQRKTLKHHVSTGIG